VVPCRNQAHYLRAALRSVAGQSYGWVETIVVDDGSTDDTAEVAASAGARLLSQSHAGVGAARNRGLQQAGGTYVVFLDADDELTADSIESGAAVLESRPDMWMVARYCSLIDAAGAPLPTNYPTHVPLDLYGEWLYRNLVWTPGAAMFRRAPLMSVGGFPVEVGPAADYAVYLELARAGRVVFDPRVAVRYRQHDSNMSRDPSLMLRATLAVLRREERHVPSRYRRHFKSGMNEWCTFYGEQIIQQLRADIRLRRYGARQLDAALLLVKECGGLAVTHLGRKVGRLLGGHPPSKVEPGRFSQVPESGSEVTHLSSPKRAG
jgi:glycosyltransferase involved in cell wall biosynthesis